MKKSRNVMFVISKPDVFKSPNADSYVVFGEAKVEDLAAKQAAIASEQARQMAKLQASAAPAAAPAAEEEAVDETGVDANDIQLVIDQTGVSRAKAVAALKNNNNDIVNSIMELSV